MKSALSQFLWIKTIPLFYGINYSLYIEIYTLYPPFVLVILISVVYVVVSAASKVHRTVIPAKNDRTLRKFVDLSITKLQHQPIFRKEVCRKKNAKCVMVSLLDVILYTFYHILSGFCNVSCVCKLRTNRTLSFLFDCDF